MSIVALKPTGALQSKAVLALAPRTVASYELELATRRAAEAGLQEILDKAEILLRQKDEAIEYHALMRRESDHRLLNDMQIVVSMLSMQSRVSGNAESSAQLVVAANRVSMIARIHRRLRGIDGVKTVAFRQYMEEFCQEFSAMLYSKGDAARVVMVDGAEIELPATTAVPLAFILSELLTNAAKYGEGQITVRLEAAPEKRHILSVCNDGPSLPDDFDPAASKGLGMKVIQSFVRRIGGELRARPGKTGHGACFSVLFD